MKKNEEQRATSRDFEICWRFYLISIRFGFLLMDLVTNNFQGARKGRGKLAYPQQGLPSKSEPVNNKNKANHKKYEIKLLIISAVRLKVLQEIKI